MSTQITTVTHKAPSSVDEWSSSAIMGTGGILAELAAEELDVENQIGAMQNKLATTAMKTQYDMVKSTAQAQYAATERDAAQTQYQAIQSAMSAGVTGLSGAYMAQTSAFDSEINSENKTLDSLSKTDEALKTQIDTVEPVEKEIGPVDAQKQAEIQDTEDASHQALRDLRNGDFKTANGVSKLTSADAEQARAELEAKSEAATKRQNTATQRMQARVQLAQTVGSFGTDVSNAVIQTNISHVQGEKATDQSNAAYSQAAAEIWKEAAQSNTQNASQALQKGQDLQAQIWQAISSAVRA